MIGAAPIPEAPSAVLRGASVDVDVRLIGRITAAVCIAALVVTSGALFWAGAQRNSQVTALRRDGIPVTVVVTGCRSLMGGSGSNLVGYSCSGTFSVAGRKYSEVIPGDAPYAPGTPITEITLRSDPGLLSAPASVATDRASWRVFVLPAALLAAALLLVGVALTRVRRPKPGGTLP